MKSEVTISRFRVLVDSAKFLPSSVHNYIPGTIVDASGGQEILNPTSGTVGAVHSQTRFNFKSARPLFKWKVGFGT